MRRLSLIVIATTCFCSAAASPADLAISTATELVARHEAFRSCPYDDLRPNVHLEADDGVQGTLTYGYGQTGPDIEIGNCIDEPSARALLKDEIERALYDVRDLVEVPMTPKQEAGWISFRYNLGRQNMANSTALRLFNDGQSNAAAESVKKWVYAKGRRLRGLEVRRQEEANLIAGRRD